MGQAQSHRSGSHLAAAAMASVFSGVTKIRPVCRALIATVLTIIAFLGAARAQDSAPSSTAERVYTAARPLLLQVRTLVAAAGRQSSTGSAFLVSDDGLALTNYHVVSQFALEPTTYRLEYVAADGSRGDLKLLAIDLANDLAVVRLDRQNAAYFRFDERALSGRLPQGERLYSMGNPLNLGFSIVEGTYNGAVDRSYNERILFSGAINPGMSGGPTVAADGRVAGINVAKRTDGELVSFLVPARFAAALVERARGLGTPTAKDIRAEIGRQLTAWQAGLYKSVGDEGFRTTTMGPYQAPESAAPWFTCWARTNAGQVPRPRAQVNTTNCSSDTRLFVASDLNVGSVQLNHSYIRSSDLNQFQFAAFLSQQNQLPWIGGFSTKWYTRQRCHEDFVAIAAVADHPPVRAVWCARAYREFDDLYDVWVVAVTQDRGTEALMSRMAVQGIAYDNAVALTRRFLEALRWTK